MKTPRPYQAEDVEWLLARDRAVHSAQPGLGKTGVALLLHERLRQIQQTHGLVVVAPKAALSVWRDEPAGWGLDIRPEILKGRGSWRWPVPGEALVLNYAILPWTPKQIKTAIADGKNPGVEIGKPTGPVHLVVDECQALRNNKSQQHVRVRTIARKCDRVTGLSGTPVGGDPKDIYHMLGALGCRPESWSWYTFLRRFNAYALPNGGHDYARNDDGSIIVSPLVKSELLPVLRRRLRKDVAAELPGKIYRYREIPHGKAAKKELAELHEQMAPFYESGDLPDFEMFGRVDSLMAQERIPHIPAAQQEREGRGEIGIFFSAHTAPILAAAERPGWAAIYGGVPLAKREQAVRDFEAGRLLGLAINIKTAATAISLPSADYVTFIDTTWDPDEQEQAEDRPNRLSRTKGPIEVEIWTSGHAVCVHRRKILGIKRGLARAVLGE